MSIYLKEKNIKKKMINKKIKIETKLANNVFLVVISL